MKRIFLSIIAIFFPWLILFMDDNPFGGLLALVLQASLIGWIPATIWAFNIINRPPEKIAANDDVIIVPKAKSSSKKADKIS